MSGRFIHSLKVKMSWMHNESGLEAVRQTVLPVPKPVVEGVGLVQSDMCAACKVHLTDLVHDLKKLTPCLEELAEVGWEEGRFERVLEPHLAVPSWVLQRVWKRHYRGMFESWRVHEVVRSESIVGCLAAVDSSSALGQTYVS